MKIHILWYVCLLIRLSMIYLFRFIYLNKTKYRKLLQLLLLLIGLGFIYQGYNGSNNEFQISKVFWHDSRYIHGTFYLLSLYYLINKKINISLMILFIDIIFSILYRVILNK